MLLFNDFQERRGWFREATLVDEGPGTRTRFAPQAGLPVEIESLGKRFREREVLREVNLRIRPGEFIAVVGRSGCGKSTLLRLLAGLEQASAGELRSGVDALDAHRDEVRIMYQDSRLLPWKRVLDNVALGLAGEGVRERALAALAQVGLAERANDWPAVLSGGQCQRVALARALVHTPRLLLLDEPLGALDALTRLEMHGLIEALWRRQRFTALLVTHDVAEAVALADRVLLIEDGRIALDEPVPQPHPRRRGDPRAAEIETRVLQRLLRTSPTETAGTPESVWPEEPLRVQALRFAI
ncbi:MAG: ATP-binding cassette domain-containing protein [Paucibacter sp.]|nr:ATP-binding cassette domain-containing protein [Roseateles sp.]